MCRNCLKYSRVATDRRIMEDDNTPAVEPDQPTCQHGQRGACGPCAWVEAERARIRRIVEDMKSTTEAEQRMSHGREWLDRQTQIDTCDDLLAAIDGGDDA